MAPSLAREHEQIEDICQAVWQKKIPPGKTEVNPSQFVSVLAESLRKLGISPPPSQW
jgi:hypothetical protein